MYCLMIAMVETIKQPTSSLLKPVRTSLVYKTAPEIISFETAERAVEYAKLRYEKHGLDVVIIPGQHDPLAMYSSMWAEVGDVCRQDPKELRDVFYSDVNDIYWDYGVDEHQKLIDAFNECEESREEREEPLPDDGKYKLAGYSSGESKYVVGVKTPWLLLMPKKWDLKFDDLTREEQEMIVDEDIKTKKAVYIDQAKMLDLSLEKLYSNKYERYIRATCWAIRKNISMKKYRISSRIHDKYRQIVRKINKFRMDKGLL